MQMFLSIVVTVIDGRETILASSVVPLPKDATPQELSSVIARKVAAEVKMAIAPNSMTVTHFSVSHSIFSA